MQTMQWKAYAMLSRFMAQTFNTYVNYGTAQPQRLLQDYLKKFLYPLKKYLYFLLFAIAKKVNTKSL